MACIRVGNPEYARENDSYGLTTLRNRHVRVNGSKVQFRFKGKSGILHELELDNRKLAAVVRRCWDLPGYDLFEYVDSDGEIRGVDSTKVNEYLREISGQDLTAKHFRTWHGTVEAVSVLSRLGPASSEADLKRKVAAAVREVAERLGNQPATCRKHYIHPAILEAYNAGVLEQKLAPGPVVTGRGLSAMEYRVLLLLRRMRSRRVAKGAKSTPQVRLRGAA
jgi:DNA topoisomerase-1